MEKLNGLITLLGKEKEQKIENEVASMEELKSIKESAKLITDILEEYSNIGTIETFKTLKEKSEPKRLDFYYCPVCRHYFEEGETHNYCPTCGQRVTV